MGLFPLICFFRFLSVFRVLPTFYAERAGKMLADKMCFLSLFVFICLGSVWGFFRIHFFSFVSAGRARQNKQNKTGFILSVLPCPFSRNNKNEKGPGRTNRIKTGFILFVPPSPFNRNNKNEKMKNHKKMKKGSGKKKNPD